jgi:hypothetical protein
MNAIIPSRFRKGRNQSMKKKNTENRPDFIESDRLARNIINALPMGIHIYRLEDDGRLVFEGANHSADSILGISNSSFIGKTIEEAFPPLASTGVPQRYRKPRQPEKHGKPNRSATGTSRLPEPTRSTHSGSGKISWRPHLSTSAIIK